MSDESPTPEAAPAAEAPGPAPAEAAPAVTEVAPGADPVVESEPQGERDITALPEWAQEYVRELREENKGVRKAHEPYKGAFSHYNESEQEYLLSMVDTLGVDQAAGAQAMLSLSQQLLGIEQAGEEAAADPEIVQAAAAEGITAEQVQQIVADTVAKTQNDAAIIAEIDAEIVAAGFTPGTKESILLLDTALAWGEADLTKVAPAVNAHLGLPTPDAPVAEVVAKPAATFPSTPSVVSPVGDNFEEPAAIPKLGSQELRDRVTRRIQEASTPG